MKSWSMLRRKCATSPKRYSCSRSISQARRYTNPTTAISSLSQSRHSSGRMPTITILMPANWMKTQPRKRWAKSTSWVILVSTWCPDTMVLWGSCIQSGSFTLCTLKDTYSTQIQPINWNTSWRSAQLPREYCSTPTTNTSFEIWVSSC